MSWINDLKLSLRACPPLFQFAVFVYKCLHPSILWQQHKNKKSQIDCYARYEAGERRVNRRYGDIEVSYEAISPKNFWHLQNGSQNEDRFMVQVLDRWVKNSKTVLDIGSHTGLWAMAFAKAVEKSGRVIAFEPEKDGYQAVLRNTRLNGLSNLTAFNMAITDKSGEVTFYVRPDKDTHSVFEKTTAPSPLGIQDTVTVQCASVDDLVNAGTIPPPDFAKIDVEGAELLVFEGMPKAAESLDAVLVEIHKEPLRLEGHRDPAETVENRLRDLGFRHFKYMDPIHVLATKEAF